MLTNLFLLILGVGCGGPTNGIDIASVQASPDVDSAVIAGAVTVTESVVAVVPDYEPAVSAIISRAPKDTFQDRECAHFFVQRSGLPIAQLWMTADGQSLFTDLDFGVVAIFDSLTASGMWKFNRYMVLKDQFILTFRDSPEKQQELLRNMGFELTFPEDEPAGTMIATQKIVAVFEKEWRLTNDVSVGLELRK